jgi:hypothetical protein
VGVPLATFKITEGWAPADENLLIRPAGGNQQQNKKKKAARTHGLEN